MLRVELIDDPSFAEAVSEQWDALAVSAAKPFCAPAWMLAWWRHSAPSGARLRVIAVHDGTDLVAVAPFFCEPDALGLARYRMLAAGTSLRVEPVARAGTEEEAAATVATALASADPAPDIVAFEGTPDASPWPRLLQRCWPGDASPSLQRQMSMPAPVLRLAGTSYDDWLASRSRNFRQQLRRHRHQLEVEGAVFRLTTAAEDVKRDLRAFAALHYARWAPKGGSGVLTPGVESMLADAAEDLLDEGRFRLWSIHVGDEVISSQLLLGAGGELSYWLGGFDAAWSAQQPSMQALVAAIQHSSEVGDRRVDLGGGPQAYKYRLTDEEEMLEWCLLLPRGRHHFLARARLLPRQAWRTSVDRIPPHVKNRVKRLLGRPVGA